MKLLLARLKTLKYLPNDCTLKYPPLGSQILAGLTPETVEIKIQDEYFEKINIFGYDAVAVGYYGYTSIPRLRKMYLECQEKKIPLIVGGYFWEKDKTTLKNNPIANTIVNGEGEGIWDQVISDLKQNKLKFDYTNDKFVDLKHFDGKRPRRDLTINKRYTMSTIQTSRGCIYRCTFCSLPSFAGFKYRSFSTQRILKEIEDCLTYPPKIENYIVFTDSDISINPTQKIELFSKFKDYNIAWVAHSDISIAYNEKLLSTFAESGCFKLHVGFESINEESIRKVNKPLFYKTKEYKKCIKKIQNYGIGVSGCFIFGLDADEPGIAKKTYDFIKEVGLDDVVVNKLKVNPGSLEYNRLKEESRLIEDGFIPKMMTIDQLDDEVEWAENNYFKNPKDRIVRRYKQGMRILKNQHIKPKTKIEMLSHLLLNKMKVGFKRNLISSRSKKGIARIID